jgi:hypothetical protein
MGAVKIWRFQDNYSNNINNSNNINSSNNNNINNNNNNQFNLLHTLCGHLTSISCLSYCPELDIILSGDIDG